MRELLTLLIPYIKKHKLFFAGVNLASIGAATAQTLIPLQISEIIDITLADASKSLLLIGFAILIGFTLLDLLANMIQRRFTVKMSQNVIFDLRQDLFEVLQGHELEFYSKESVGQIMSRSIEEVYSMRELLTWGYRITALVTFLFIGSIVSIMRISWQLGLVFLIIPIIVVVLTTKTSARNKELFYGARFKFGELSEVLAENLSGIQTVKSFGAEDEQIQNFNVYNQEFYKASMKTAGVRALIIPGMIFLIASMLIGLVFLGGGMVAMGDLTVGNFVAFMLLSLNIAIPGRFLGFIGILIQDGNSAAIRINEILQSPPFLDESKSANDVDSIKGKIEFENVSFGYPGANNSLCNINFTIKPGEKIALLGKTGSGKSSLINLLPRFFDPTEGRILIDDKDIRTDYTMRSLRKLIGIVHQESFLFTVSLHENIAFGCAGASREDVINAAKAAQIHEFIETLEDGYDTIVGERGITLSGGQRQRVSIAQTLMTKPKILVFDDSVSAIDPKTEARIQDALQESMKDRTTIIISQRPSSLQYVNKVFVLDNGNIIQSGTHDELMANEGAYRDYISQVYANVKFMDWELSPEVET